MQISGSATRHPDDTIEYHFRTLLGRPADDDSADVIALIARRVFEATLCVGAALLENEPLVRQCCCCLHAHGAKTNAPSPHARVPRSRDTGLPLLLSLGLATETMDVARELIAHLEKGRPWGAAAPAAPVADDDVAMLGGR